MNIDMKFIEKQYKTAYSKYLSAFPAGGTGRWSESEEVNRAWQTYLCDACDEYMRAIGTAFVFILSTGGGGAKFENLFRQWNEDVQVSLGWKEDPEDVRRRKEIQRKREWDQWITAIACGEMFHHMYHDDGDSD